MRDPWAVRILQAYRWRAKGGDVTQLIDQPTQALLDGVLALEDEGDAIDRERMAEIDAKGGGGGST